jgi:uncharacterized protein YjbI with pentapeptide repeats
MEQQGLWERAERLRGGADEAARLVQNVYLSFLLFSTYIAIIIASTTDMQLLKVSPVTLPLLNVQLPIVGFYVVVPWLLLLFYFNLLLLLTFLAQKLHRLNAMLAAFPDDTVREEQRVRLFPFPFSAMLSGRPARWRLRMLLGLMIWTTVLLLPLVLLLWAQLRFLPYHDTAITWNHRAAVLVDVMLLWLFWPLIFIPERAAWRQARARYLRWGTGVSLLTLVTVVFSLGIAVLPEEGMEKWMASHMPKRWRHVDPPHSGKAVFVLTAWLHRHLWLQEQVLVAGEPSAKILAALRSKDATKQAQGLDEIAGLILTNRDLRGANLRDTLLAKADLRGANLHGANLAGTRAFAVDFSGFSILKGESCLDDAQQLEDKDQLIKPTYACATNLQDADLRGAQLQGADLQYAQLQGARLWVAQLQGARLWTAQLQGADLKVAKLQDASLWGAELQGADLSNAELQGAYLQYANFQGASLRGAELQDADLQHAELQGADLFVARLQGADLWDARLQGAYLQQAQLQGADLRHARLQGADLQYAQLQGADLRHAQLQGADLQYAQLQGTDLQDTQLQGADLQYAQLQGANLEQTRIGSADFTGVDLALSNLRELSLSPLDEKTYEELERVLTHAIGDEHRRADRLKQIKGVVRRPAQLKAAHSADQVMCDDVNLFPSCLTQEKIADYARARASFLIQLGCDNSRIAYRIVTWHRTTEGINLPHSTTYLMLVALAKSFTALQEKDCPGWAALPVGHKAMLRTLAAEEKATP